MSHTEVGGTGVRAAFAQGPASNACHTLNRALDNGLTWESALDQVAKGLGDYYGWPEPAPLPAAPVRKQRRRWLPVIAAITLCLL
jgi:hypothetical protein